MQDSILLMDLLLLALNALKMLFVQEDKLLIPTQDTGDHHIIHKILLPVLMKKHVLEDKLKRLMILIILIDYASMATEVIFVTNALQSKIKYLPG